MANKQRGQVVTLDTTGGHSVGNTGHETVGSFTMQFQGTGWTGSVVVRARVFQSNATWLAIPYRRLNVAGVASDNTYVSTAITANGLIVVEADGLEVQLDYTHSAGFVQVFCAPLLG